MRMRQGRECRIIARDVVRGRREGSVTGMPFRNATTLQRWLDEFLVLQGQSDGSIRVMEQDGAGGADTGLVSVRLANASTVTYIHPEGAGSTTWLVTMEPRETPVVLESEAVAELAEELDTVARLCAFLERKSAEYMGLDSP